ncbi:cyclin-dependent kinase F-1-like [Telopea speciosissima]|uniref:cyclin-dependent kinase F-1-like n=1 Tax=Telopea speciosissima TaxID=54955 RepID=UPI001CC59417|nr:cyclin-dependent kinase F-1-like [Telopea speciosissima]XP_043724293.1 cyclin-dependent kinase F-1-like [Telopea speciosissima]
MDPPSKSWSIYGRPEITQRYEILEQIGSGAYSDVYRARRRSDDIIVALKEVHDYQSSFREIEALQTLQNSPNIIVLHEYFWREDEDAVLVLEYLRTDLASVIRETKRSWENRISVGEIKRWMIQILHGIDACHRNAIVHRDLKPCNLLISSEGVLKLADFGQSRILLGPGFTAVEDHPDGQNTLDQTWLPQQPEFIQEADNSHMEGSQNQEQITMIKAEISVEVDDLGAKDEADKESNFHDGGTSCFATCTTSDMEEDPLNGSYSYDDEGGEHVSGALTSCVGTRWFRAPELLYGSTSYGQEIDLWSLGCIFAELLNLEPLFPGTSDIDQLSRIINVLGNLTEETWQSCCKLPDYGKISFGKVENPLGLESCLPNRSSDEIYIVKRLVCYDPGSRATAMELLNDRYFNQEPLPVPVNELRIPSTNSGPDESSPGVWCDYKDMDSDSDFDEFGRVDFSTTGTGFSIRFS